MLQPVTIPNVPALLSVLVSADGRIQVGCGVPKLEAVKLLLGVVEDLRIQAMREDSKLIQVAPPSALG